MRLLSALIVAISFLDERPLETLKNSELAAEVYRTGIMPPDHISPVSVRLSAELLQNIRGAKLIEKHNCIP